MEDALADTEYQLETATDVSDLETRLLSDANVLWQVDMFIFDFDMPEMTGTQIASVLDALYKELKANPFVIFSGRPRDEVLASIQDATKYSPAFSKNFRGYIEKKGESVTDLINKIHEVLL